MTPGPIDFNSVKSSAMQPAKNGVQTSEMQKNNPGGIFKEAKDTGHNPTVTDYENIPYQTTISGLATGDVTLSYEGTVPYTNTVSVENPYTGETIEVTLSNAASGAVSGAASGLGTDIEVEAESSQ